MATTIYEALFRAEPASLRVKAANERERHFDSFPPARDPGGRKPCPGFIPCPLGHAKIRRSCL